MDLPPCQYLSFTHTPLWSVGHTSGGAINRSFLSSVTALLRTIDCQGLKTVKQTGLSRETLQIYIHITIRLFSF